MGWDDAVPGGSCEQAAFLRTVLDETAGCMDFQVGTILRDLEKFYDSVDLLRLCDYAEQMHFPRALLALCLQLYIAPRLLRGDVSISEQVWPSASILAGCAQANNMARMFLHPIMGQLARTGGLVKCRQFVDDLPMRAEGTERLVCLQLPARAAWKNHRAASRTLAWSRSLTGTRPS